MENIRQILISPKLKILTLFGLFLGVTFYFQYTFQPWIYFGCATFTLILTLFFEKNVSVPSTLQLRLYLGLFALLALISLLNGNNLLEERWLLRYLVIILIFTAMQFIKTDDDLFKYLRWPLTAFMFYVTLESLTQFFVLYDNYSGENQSLFSSRFLNIDLFAQGLVASLPFILFFHKKSEKLWSFWYELLILLMTTCVWLSVCRSAWIVLVIFYFIELIRPLALTRKKTIFLFVASLILYKSLQLAKNTKIVPVGQYKVSSMNYRLVLWKRAIQIAANNPAGIGTGRYLFDMISYFDGERWSNKLDELSPSPHSEVLRILAEEGWAILAIFIVGFGYLYWIGFRKIYFEKKEALFFRYMFCLLPEIIFQFPSEMFLPSLLFCLSFATYLNEDSQIVSFNKIKYWGLAVFCALTLSAYTVRNFYTVPLTYSKTFCDVFHDNWLMCRRYFAEYYVDNKIADADHIIRSQLKWQPFNFYMLAADYSLAVEPRSSVAACLYYNLFNGEKTIEGADLKYCKLEKDRKKIMSALIEYAEKR